MPDTPYPAKILRVNLTEKKIEEEDVDSSIVEKFIGGKGFAAYYLYKELKPGTDPYSPDNKIMVFTGPLTLLYPSFARHVVASKSPLTGTFFDSYAGGAFGTELRRTGYIGIIVEGRAEDTVYLKITKDEVALKDGRSLKGKTTYEVCEAFKGYSVLTIGPAGENLVRFAGVFNDMVGPSRAGVAGRGGLGAVFGSKNLKAIVVKGWLSVHDLAPRIDKEKADKVLKEYLDIILKEVAPGMGLGGNLPVCQLSGDAKVLPVKNFQKGFYEKWVELSEEAWKNNLVSKNTCPTCPVRCGVRVRAKKKPYAPVEVERMEYETVAMNGANLMIGDRDVLIAAAHKINALGLDSISLGSVVAFAMEAYEKGHLKDYEIRWGDAEAYLKLIEMIAYRRGIGDLLAEGVARASEKLGAEDIAVHVKGLEIPAYDPRGVKGMALAYATADRGGCHLRAWTVAVEVLEKPDRDELIKLVKYLQDRNAALWTLIICDNIPGYANDPDKVVKLSVEMLNTIGFNLSLEEFLKIGERIYNLTRLFNIREGFSRKDDSLPKRFFEPREDTGWRVTREELDYMLDKYYELRGWDKATGAPLKETLEKLDLANISQ